MSRIDPREAFPQFFRQLEAVTRPNAYGTCKARCPAHADGKPSLTAWVGKNGKLVISCQAGCEKLDILKAIGLEFKDLVPADRLTGKAPEVRREEVCRYAYTDEHGELCHETIRYRPKSFGQCSPGPGGLGEAHTLGGGWYVNTAAPNAVPVWARSQKDQPGSKWKEPARMQLYRLVELAAAPNRVAFWCEGEKDCDALAGLGFLATTTACGSDAPWHPNYSRWVKDRHFAVIPDHDEPGYKYASRTIGRLVMHGAASVTFLPVTSQECGDAADWVERMKFDGKDPAAGLKEAYKVARRFTGAPARRRSPA